jgi:hypothetical protein
LPKEAFEMRNYTVETLLYVEENNDIIRKEVKRSAAVLQWSDLT